MRRRLYAWKMQFIIINIAMIMIFPSQHLKTFRDLVDNENEKIQSLLDTLMYYMFIGGVFHQKCSDKTMWPTYWEVIWGYLLTYVLCLFERIYVSWLVDKFNCTEENYQKINVLERRIAVLNQRIDEANKKIESHDQFSKVELMKALRL